MYIAVSGGCQLVPATSSLLSKRNLLPVRIAMISCCTFCWGRREVVKIESPESLVSSRDSKAFTVREFPPARCWLFGWQILAKWFRMPQFLQHFPAYDIEGLVCELNGTLSFDWVQWSSAIEQNRTHKKNSNWEKSNVRFSNSIERKSLIKFGHRMKRNSQKN